MRCNRTPAPEADVRRREGRVRKNTLFFSFICGMKQEVTLNGHVHVQMYMNKRTCSIHQFFICYQRRDLRQSSHRYLLKSWSCIRASSNSSTMQIHTSPSLLKNGAKVYVFLQLNHLQLETQLLRRRLHQIHLRLLVARYLLSWCFHSVSARNTRKYIIMRCL